MKNILFSIALVLPALFHAQLDRSVKPNPGTAPTINIKDSEVFTTSNGITVILSENHKLPRVSFDLFTGGDPRIEGNKAGLSEMAGSLILSGTANRSKDKLDGEIDYIGASINASENSLSLSCLTKHMGKGLELISDVLINANFPQSEFDRIKKQNESGLMATRSDAASMARNAEVKVNFPNHPFGGVMTEATLSNISRADIEAYYRSTFTPKGSYLVIVGDITAAEAHTLVEKHFGAWKGTEAYKQETNKGQFNKGNRVIFVKKPGAVQSVVYVSFPMDIRTGDQDQLAMSVLNGILGGGGFGTRLMQNLREDKAYTYGCYSSTNITEHGSWMSMGGNFRNAVTDSAIAQILFEMDRITTSYVTDEELNLTKSSMAGGFARSLERPSTVARFAYNIIKNNLAKDYYQTYLQRLEAINKEDVLLMAQKYFTAKNCNIVVVGNEEIIDRLKQFDADGKIEMLDAFGDELKEIEKSNITADQLLEKYVFAVTKTGNTKELTKKMKKIKTYSEVMDLKIPQAPMPFKNTKIWMSPNQEGTKMEGMGMVLQKSYFDGTAGASTNMQTGKTELTAAEIGAKKKSVGLFPEMNYKTSGMQYELLGIEQDGNSKVYVLKLNDGESEVYDYYDTKTFYKVKSLSITTAEGETNESTVTYSDFKEVNGILFPHQANLSIGEMNLSGTVTSIVINGKVDLNSFK